MTEMRWPIWVHHPLEVRSGTSDIDVFNQIFTAREYAPLDDLKDVSLVIDCGAYVGYSAAYFLSKWPGCQLIAFEANDDNFRQCKANLKPYKNVALNRAAVWSHNRGVSLSPFIYRDGREWSFQVCEAVRCDPFVPSFDLNGIHGLARISLLKMDIEGAEAVVFSAPDLSWIDRVDNLVIETHDDTSFGPNVSRLVADVMGSRGFAESRYGELTFYRRHAS